MIQIPDQIGNPKHHLQTPLSSLYPTRLFLTDSHWLPSPLVMVLSFPANPVGSPFSPLSHHQHLFGIQIYFVNQIFHQNQSVLPVSPSSATLVANFPSRQTSQPLIAKIWCHFQLSHIPSPCCCSWERRKDETLVGVLFLPSGIFQDKLSR